MYLLIPLLLLALVFYVASRIHFWIKEAPKLQQSGYLTPEPPLLATLFMRSLTRFLRFVAVGPTKVIGIENTDYPGRLLIVPNHTFELDFAMVQGAVPSSFRYLASAAQLKGMRGPLAAWTGAIGVNFDDPNRGQAVIDASVNALVATPTSRLLIFPQGQMVRDNVLRPEEFKTGAVRIARLASEKVGREPVALLPVAIHYVRDRSRATWLHKMLHRCGLTSFRRLFGYANYGAVVVVGEPIPIESLPEDARQATEQLRLTVQGLLATAAAQEGKAS